MDVGKEDIQRHMPGSYLPAGSFNSTKYCHHHAHRSYIMRKAVLDFKAGLKKKIKKVGRSSSPASRVESAHGQAAPTPAEDDTVQNHTNMGESVQQAGDALSAMRSPQGTTHNIVSAVDNAPSTIDEITSLATTWQPLLNNLKAFSSLVDKIAEV